MESDQKQFSIVERFVVVTIILLVSALMVQNVLHSVKVSERRTLNNAAVDYEAVKSMYGEQHQTAAASILGGNAASSADTHNTPGH
jgi:type II secretory pathway pseudopilin PulG